MTDITTIVNIIIALIGALITTFLIPWIKSKTTEAQRVNLEAWINIAVAAAEQIFVGEGKGAEKKAYVIAFLEKNGYKVDETKIDAAIEAAVNSLKTAAKTPTVAVKTITK